jgi:hypothetical protein
LYHYKLGQAFNKQIIKWSYTNFFVLVFNEKLQGIELRIKSQIVVVRRNGEEVENVYETVIHSTIILVLTCLNNAFIHSIWIVIAKIEVTILLLQAVSTIQVNYSNHKKFFLQTTIPITVEYTHQITQYILSYLRTIKFSHLTQVLSGY